MRQRVMGLCGFAALACVAQLGLAASASAASMLYWTTDASNSVLRTDLNGTGHASTFASGFDAPEGLVFDRAGNLYVANWSDNKVSKVTPAGHVTSFASGFNLTAGLAFSVAGNLFVADNSGGPGATVSKVTPAGQVSTFASGFDEPEGLTFDSAGNLYVAGYYGVSEVTPGGQISSFGSDAVNDPQGLAFNSSGYLFVANDGTNSILKISPAGTTSTFLSGSEINQPEGLVFDSRGNLYLASYGAGKILKITPSGRVTTFASGVQTPAYLAIEENPVGTRVPALEGKGTVGAPLSCGPAAWAPSPPGGLRFQSPISTGIRWKRNGSTIPGAHDAKYTPGQSGSYRCFRTATNPAGTSSQESAALQVKAKKKH